MRIWAQWGGSLGGQVVRQGARALVAWAVLAGLLGSVGCRGSSRPAEKGDSEPISPTPVLRDRWVSLPSNARWIRPQAVLEGEREEAPDIAVDGSGDVWLAWASFATGAEHIRVRRISGALATRAMQAGSPMLEALEASADAHRVIELQLGEGRGPTGFPAIAAAGEDVWVAWSERLEAGFRIRLAQLRSGALDSVRTLAADSGHAFRPALALDALGRPWVAFERLSSGRSSIQVQPPVGDPILLDDSGELNLRPALTALGDGMAVAWDHYEDRAYDLRLARLTSSGALEAAAGALTRDPWLDQAPSLATDRAGSLWIAWHSDRPNPAADASRESPESSARRGGRTLVLARVEGDDLFLPPAGFPPALSALKDRVEIEDCIEFPVLKFDGRNRPILFGRRAQGFVSYVLEGETWSAPLDLSDPGWGGRGRNLRAALDATGAFHLTARWLHRVGYGLLEPADGPMARPAVRAEPQSRVSAPLPVHPQHAQKLGVMYRATLTEGAAGPPPAERSTGKRRRTLRKGLPTQARAQGLRVFLGDLHTHTAVSDGNGDPDEVFTRARDVLGHDFVALTDHDVSNGNRYSPSEWAYAVAMSNHFHAPGHFATLIAYEWTSDFTSRGGGGHRNVYFSGDDAPLFGVDLEAPDTRTLFELLRATDALTIPHHTSWTGTEWEHFDPVLQPLFEVVSVHGASERAAGGTITPRSGEGGTYAVEGLQRGLRFGFVGGSDGHGVPWHFGVSRQADVWSTGLTGIYAAELDRKALHAALRARCTYATSGPPMGLWMEVNGIPMGGVIEAAFDGKARARHRSGRPTAPPVLVWRVYGLETLRSVELVRGGETMAGFHPELQEDISTGSFELSWPEMADGPAGGLSYYLRITRQDGAMAWSSPVWIVGK